jgi:uncharacterized membrane protein YeaQ/YmgE (transglycosylase-associated protein family)
MDQRIKLFGVIAIIGFIAGVIAALAIRYVPNWLRSIWPSLSGMTDFIVAGIVGAILAVVLIAVWALVSGKKDQYY